MIWVLKIDMELSKGILFVRLDGYLNRNTSYKINNYLVPVILKHKIKYLVYNLDKLIDIDENGIDAFLNTKYAVKNNKGNLYLCEINPQLTKKISKLHIKKILNETEAKRIIEV